jgi:hypothetical protein
VEKNPKVISGDSERTADLVRTPFIKKQSSEQPLIPGRHFRPYCANIGESLAVTELQFLVGGRIIVRESGLRLGLVVMQFRRSGYRTAQVFRQNPVFVPHPLDQYGPGGRLGSWNILTVGI